MWEKVVECVPNVSEGRNRETIEAIVSAVSAVKEVRVLDVESDPDHNRSVITLAGTPEGVKEAVRALFREALPRIDLRVHRGEHPRMGAVDVVPFVPVRGVTMEDCVALSREVGQMIWEEFRVPVYLYANSATRPEREDLAAIRKGEFEGFFEKIKDPKWRPDFGEPEVHHTAGVVAVGAREFLIAYNVYLNTNDVRIAKAIARAVRGSSGGLRYVKALGFEIKERGLVQVSMNLTNYKKTPIPRVLELIRREAARYGVSVVESEIVGLVPQEALDQVVEYYLQLRGFRPGMVFERRLEEALKG